MSSHLELERRRVCFGRVEVRARVCIILRIDDRAVRLRSARSIFTILTCVTRAAPTNVWSVGDEKADAFHLHV